MTVMWTAGTGATSHTVTVGTEGEDDRTQTVPADSASATFENLTEGKTYGVVVTAVNESGTVAASVIFVGVDTYLVSVTDDILTNTAWTNDKIYLLRGPIFVGKDIDGSGGVAVTLTIEPGTTILGDVDPPQGARGSYLVVARGSKLIADANANLADKSVRPDPDSVIVFTSSAPRGQRARGDWGGLVINGRAPINTGTEAQGEGESGLYGGTDPNDSSGILRGVRVEFAGDRVTATDELNGIALQGVGAGTTVDYVQVHYNTDDGYEPFGGTVSVTHAVATGIGDDSFDGTDGYQGFMQFLIAQQRADDADNGFEISNEGTNPLTAAPHSSAIVANATMIGADSVGLASPMGTGEIQALGAKSDIAIGFREGSNYRLFNILAVGFGKAGLCFEDPETQAVANARVAGGTDPAQTLRFENSILWNNVDASDTTANYVACGGATQAEQETFLTTYDNIIADPSLPAEAFSVGSMSSPPNFIPTATPGSYTAFDPATLNGASGVTMPTDGRTLQTTSYAGAVEPGTALADAWYYGWTVWSTDGSDSRPNHEGN
jgi:hypothetical protein